MSTTGRTFSAGRSGSRSWKAAPATDTQHSSVQQTTPAVLVLDDDRDHLAEITRLLELHGCEVIACSSPDQALDSLSASPVDVMVCDVRLTGVTGFEVVRKVRRMRVNSRKSRLLPVIAVSAGGGNHSRAALESGANLYCEKRDALRKLPEQIRSLVR